MDDDKIICEICGEKGFNYKETMYDHPRYAESDEQDIICEDCFRSGINFQ